ncbi:MAG: TIGR02680 family protein [Gammaproteobacteria bacterium]|nr:TIGR02680 family protein [Gammaproteobacteria bacterium]
MNAPERPPLPEPALRRWQPLRLGLIELYHYDSEEFHFRDGHIMLRGNNGTGKSKVLSLTLPFLFDANLSASRVEPDGDRGKRMDWNLLMGGRHERRIGYTWIEFGRVGEDGQPRFLTLGAGLRAVGGRASVDAWYFTSSQRVGEDLWLTTPHRTAIAKDRLAEAIGTHGQVFDTAMHYRRAVDEALFRLGSERYDALIDTLIQLRQPQLSKQPNEQRLSDALSDALPPLERGALEDVAEAMNQLDDYRRELDELDAMRKAVSGFAERYGRYAQIAARRRAAELRAAQTRYDQASRELNAADSERSAAQQAESEAREAIARHERVLDEARARLKVLRADPVMRDAQRLQSAETEAAQARQSLDRAQQRLHTAQRRHQEEQATSVRRNAAAEATRRVQIETLHSAMSLAAPLALEPEQSHALESVELPDGVVAADERFADTLRGRLHAAVKARQEQIELVRKRLREHQDALRKRELAHSERNARADDFAAAEAQHEAAARQLQTDIDALLAAWRHYLGGLHTLRLPDSEDALAALETWAETLAGEQPMRSLLDQARDAQQRQLAASEAALEQHRQALAEERAALHQERDALEAGTDAPPPALYYRDAATRARRSGAPLWQLVDFDPSLEPAQRAGLEAALEAAGLLDAWITPGGEVLDPTSLDARLLPRGTQADSLADSLASRLRPAADTPIAPAIIESILASIACDAQDPSNAEAWVSTAGSYRLGPLAGHWSKPAARYIGYAAREAARRQRLDEIGARLAELGAQAQALDAQSAALADTRQRLRQELAAAPGDDALRTAHATTSQAERQRRDAQRRLGEADGRLAQAEHASQRSLDALRLDAEDLRLPADGAALESLAQTLSDYRLAVTEFAAALRAHRGALLEWQEQQAREARSHSDLATAEGEYGEQTRRQLETATELQTLRDSVGVKVHELQQRIADAESAETRENEGLSAAHKAQLTANAHAAAAEQKRSDAQRTLDERGGERLAAIDGLRLFAATGLLAIAVPELELPDTAQSWGVEAGLTTARRTEQALGQVAAEDEHWHAISRRIGEDFTELQRALSAQGHSATLESSDHGLIVRIVYQSRPERPDLLGARLEAEIGERRMLLSAREREVLENHLQQDIAVNLQRLIQDTERRVASINGELHKRPTSTGVRYRLDWQNLPDDTPDAPSGLAEARKRLLKTHADAWSPDDRRTVGDFLQTRIREERQRDERASLFESLSRALDYRRWHRFRVQRQQDGAWKPLSGPASSGERALGLTVPLFAAASSHYESADPLAPRLVLLDEAFAGIDDEARANCMALIREFDLDFVMTSEREWGCYAELPGLSICQIVRREGIDAIFVSRWSWDGRVRRAQDDPGRRFPEATPADGASNLS